MTYLIADSGATKTEWRLESDTTSETFYTEGLNPYYHTRQSIARVLSDGLLPELNADSVDQIYFYGAGCDNDERKQVLADALLQAFPNADADVEHDLLASARACFRDNPGIACILGTGSNSCLYDGNEIVEHIPSLAFILGDEGSAGYFGKKLINAYFRREIPEELQKDLEASHNMSLDYIMKELYDGTQKSRFVASYGKFLGDHHDHPYIKGLLREGFESFIRRIVKKYSDAESRKVGFVGSVAFAHQDLINSILKEEGLQSGPYIRKPLEELIAYHTGG